MFTIDEIIAKALSMHLIINGKSKCEIIRMIQQTEGFTPCYGTKRVCLNDQCCWHSDCNRMVVHCYNVVE
jgi:hypothetical protein